MSFLGKLSKVIVPTAIGFATGGPAGAFAAGVGASQAEKANRQFKQAQEQQAREASKQSSLREKAERISGRNGEEPLRHT